MEKYKQQIMTLKNENKTNTHNNNNNNTSVSDEVREYMKLYEEEQVKNLRLRKELETLLNEDDGTNRKDKDMMNTLKLLTERIDGMENEIKILRDQV